MEMITEETLKEEKEQRCLEFIKKIQPLGGISFKDESTVKTGDTYETCLHIMNYPSSVNDFWLTKITNNSNTIVTIDVSNTDVDEVVRNINKSMKEVNSRYGSSTNYTDEKDAIKDFQDYDKLLTEVKSMKEVTKIIDTRMFLADRSWLDLDNRVKKMKQQLDNDTYLAYVNMNETKQDYCSIFESYTEQQKEKFAVSGSILSSASLAAGNPFHFSSLEDPNGSFYGTTPTMGQVLWDIFRKTKTRLHYNMAAFGTMGAGKSTILKKIAEDRVIRGDYVRTFDVSGENILLCKILGGTVIKMDGTNDTALNPLEILKSGFNDNESYTRHISKLKTMYLSLKPTAESTELSKLSAVLDEIYQKFDLKPGSVRGITGRAAEEYPIFSDVHEYIAEEINEMSQREYSKIELDLAKRQALLLSNIDMVICNLINIYGNIFDRHSSITNLSDEQYIIFDISKLKDMESSIFDAQLYNLLSLCWDNVVTNGTIMIKKVREGEIAPEDVIHTVIEIDEAHRIINTNKTNNLDLITTYMREGRKYYGSIILASQSVRDFSPEGDSGEALNKLKTVFELTQYKMIFHQDANALPLLKNIFESVLTPSQINRIPQLERGNCIMSISSDVNLEFSVYITDEENYLFDGGQ